MKPDFDTALQQHFAAICNRDIEAFKSHLTSGDTLYTIIQNGQAFTTPAESLELHEQWFKDPTLPGRTGPPRILCTPVNNTHFLLETRNCCGYISGGVILSELQIVSGHSEVECYC